MATRRGNTTNYAKQAATDASPHETGWRERVKNGHALRTGYDQASASFPAKVSHEDLLASLEALASAFGDSTFSEAAIVLKSYNFNKGGIKRQVLNILSKYRGKSILAAVPIMDQFIESGHSKREAAEIAVEATGVQGTTGAASFKSVVDEVRAAYASERRSKGAPAEECAREWPGGDTGRKMKIAWVRPWKMPPGAEPADMGCFIVPDNRAWRRAVRDGTAIRVEMISTPNH
jgi:hypothetical protein